MLLEKLKNLVEDPITGEWGSKGNGVSILRTTNFNNDGTLNLNDVVKRDISSDKIKKKKLRDGDIIIEKSGGSPNQPVGRVVFFDIEGDYLCNNFTSVLRPKNKTIYPKYLHYSLFANHKYRIVNKFQNKTTGIINLQLKRYLEKTIIPLPPLETQKKIAEILDQADALRKKTQQIIDSYDELVQSIFLDMFGDPVTNPKGWPMHRLGDMQEIKCQNGHYAPKEDYSTTGVQMIHMSDAFYKIVTPGALKRVVVNEKLLEKFSLLSTDLLLSRRSLNYEGSAKPCIIPNINEPLIYESSLIRLRPKKNLLNSLFLFYFLDNPRARSKYVFKYVTKSTISGINNKGVNLIEIYVPPLELQNQFADRIGLIEQQKDLTKQSLKQSEDLFNALLQKAFKGELVNSE